MQTIKNLFNKGIDINKEAKVYSFDNYMRPFVAGKIQELLAAKATNVEVNRELRQLMRQYQDEHSTEIMPANMVEIPKDYIELMRSKLSVEMHDSIFENIKVDIETILQSTNGLDAQMINYYESRLMQCDASIVESIISESLAGTENTIRNSLQDVKNSAKVAKAYFNLLKNAALKLGIEPLKLGSNSIGIDNFILRRMLNDVSMEFGVEINDDDVISLINTALKDLIGLIGEHKIDLETAHMVAVSTIKIIALSRREHPDNASIRQLVLPNHTEIHLLQDWLIQSILNGGTIKIITTVCPDYDYEVNDGVARFTGKGVNDGIGIVGKNISRVAPNIVNLFEELGLTVEWQVGYAGFEANENNLAVNNVTHDEFHRRLLASSNEMKSVVNREVGILPESLNLNISKHDFWEIKRILSSLGSFTYKREGMEGLAAATEGTDWVVAGLIASATNSLILDGASAQMGRHFYDIGMKIGQQLARLSKILDGREIGNALDDKLVQKELFLLSRLLENESGLCHILKGRLAHLVNVITTLSDKLGWNFNNVPRIFITSNYVGY